jgi:hypothetical protein
MDQWPEPLKEGRDYVNVGPGRVKSMRTFGAFLVVETDECPEGTAFLVGRAPHVVDGEPEFRAVRVDNIG